MNGKVYIIILNWNGWEDTIECLESVFRNDYPNYKVVVCDNNSSNHSMEKIKEWAEGQRLVNYSKGNLLYDIYPPVKKPISYIELNKNEIEKLNDSEGKDLILIQTGGNLGFAGGNNIGARYALNRDDFEYIWFLNNDTIIQKDALINLVMDSKKFNSGICGSKLLYYDRPEKIQGLAGKYNKFSGKSRHILKEEEICFGDYVIGASMLISKQFLKTVGLMNEKYFLYYEELDWSYRNKGRFSLSVSLDSVVYHKESASTGQGNEITEFYLLRNRILFSKRYMKIYYPICFLSVIISIFNVFKKRPYKRFEMFIKVMKSVFCS